MFRETAIVFLLAAALSLPSTARAQHEPVRAPALFADAMEVYHERLYAQAARSFAHFRARYPESAHAPEALYYQARAALALDRDERAVALFDRLQVQYPAHPLASDAQLQLGRYFAARGQYDRAHSVLERMIERRPNSPQAARALYALGRTARSQDRYAEAAGYFQEVVDKFPDAAVAPDALYALAAVEVQRERYAAAARVLERLARRYPDAPQARTLGLALAEVYYELDRYEQAVAEIERRFDQLAGDEQARALFLKAEAHHQLGQPTEAIAAYQRYVESYPRGADHRAARFGLAWNLLQQEQYRRAAEHFEQVRLGSHGDLLSARATYYAAVSRQAAGQLDAALSLYRAASEQTGTEHMLADHALYEAGRLLYMQERWAEARTALERLVSEFSQSEARAEALVLLGHVRAAEGAPRAALARYEEALAQENLADALRREARFQRALLLYRIGRYAAAGEVFRQFVRTYPQSRHAGDARFRAGESFYQTGAYDRAQALFAAYLGSHPDGAHADAARYARAWSFFKQRRYAEAASAFAQFLSSYEGDGGEIPYETDARLRLADSYYALKRYGEAVQAYRTVEGSNRDYALYQTAQALYLDDRPAQAIDALRRLLQQYPQSSLGEEARFRLGDIQFEQQNYQAAITTFRSLIAAHPDDPLAARAQYAIGDAFYNAGRLDAAVDAYRDVLADYPNSTFVSNAASSIQYALQAQGASIDASALADSLEAAGASAAVADELRFREALVEYRSGRTDEALRDFRRFVRTASTEGLVADAYYYIGLIYADRGAYDTAENYLRQVIENYSGGRRRLDAAARLGAIHRRQGRPSAALEVYRRMEEMAEGQPAAVAEARYGQSMALLELGRPAEAERLLQQVIDSAPQTPEATSARLGLARIHQREGRRDAAERLYRRVSVEADGAAGAEALYRLGTLLLAQDRSRAAIEELSRLPALYPGYTEWVARSYLAQARAFRRLDQPANAVRLYDRVLAEFAGTSYAETAAREKAAL